MFLSKLGSSPKVAPMGSIRRIAASILIFCVWTNGIVECTLPDALQSILDDSLPGEHAREINTRGNECITQFQECVSSYFGYFNDFHENYTSGSTIFVDEEGVDQMCQLAESLEQCLENTRGLCESSSYWGSQRAHYYTSLVEYVCSDDGKIVFLQTNGSQCGRQDTINRLQSQCQRSAQKTFLLEKKTKPERLRQSPHCSYQQKHRQCILSAIRDTCGQALAELMSQIDQAINGDRYAYEKTLNGC